MSVKRGGLGRGLGELLGGDFSKVIETTKNVDVPSLTETITGNTQKNVEGLSLQRLPVEYLHRGRYQPRREMDPAALEELAQSIREQGIIQPILVRPINDKQYEIIAGERRWRAAQQAGLKEVPVVVKSIPDEAAMAIGLIENIQREDLNPIEEAMGLKRLLEEFGLTHEEIAQSVGKSRVSVTNLLRLLNLNPEVRTLLERGEIDMGHARALLALTGMSQTQAAQTIVEKRLSVREAERLIRQWHDPKATTPNKEHRTVDPHVYSLQKQLSERLGAAVEIQHSAKGKGKLVINYYSLEELDGILRHIH